MQAALGGFALGLSLIVAIGAQNAFVLRQGLLRSHVFTVCLICALSDALLILLGVTGFGALTTAVPGLETAMRWLGAAFLIWYGARSLFAAWRGGETLRAGGADPAGSRRAAILTCLAFTWLNPHVYLDTVVLLGAVSAQYEPRAAFAAGAMIASFLFFFSLGYGARALGPLFEKPLAWRVLDLLIGLVMWAIAARLAFG
ncbi:MAG: amino acid transporter [Rhodobacteraceae bacterium]|jgi:L-lysine exporter family protein LysE/ArgO|uniref:L-lysine exporter family protein LysE/ArgO n=1 Tax=Salipiger profundus TaxID=1229727 RepID=A0A1U7D7G2_9RHOB|nr:MULTISPECIES: LysE/ArgO family amino acid transporter [Salipiger]APX24048.1 L-lysine exporter family protein LysE/ArgO [Salipiger profundus]MAB06841.1 amino acid transporter [Paracoccaceae bacterium]GFZ94230.1 amino acid transporter [Salipiger profundus]SFB92634.1 L-lysine exporter family protein LysE/ArgO [Salipiger profundus]